MTPWQTEHSFSRYSGAIGPNAMNLRNVTIRTTGVMLIGTILLPYVYTFTSTPGFLLPPSSTIITSIGIVLCGSSVLWLFSGSPMLVSFIVAKKLKYNVPFLILFVSTVAYGCLFVSAQCLFLTDTNSCTRGFWLLMPLSSLWWMIPTWVTALLLNRYYATKTPDPGTAARTPSSPAPLED